MGDKRSEVRLIGLDYLQFASIPVGKHMMTSAASFSTIGNVVPDSANFVIEPPDVTDHYIEEEDAPDIQMLGTSKKSVVFSLRDMGTQTLLYAFGGTAAAGVYSASTTAIVVNELQIKAVSKEINGKTFTLAVPRVNVRAGGNLRFGKAETGTLEFTCDILMPSSSTKIPPWVFTSA